METRNYCTLAVLLLLSAQAVNSAGASWCTERKVDGYGGNITQLVDCPSVHALLLVPYLWTPVQITVKCPNTWYTVFTGSDEKALAQSIDKKDGSWCGWESVIDGRLCKMQVSPFQRTLIGVKNSRACTVTSEASTSYFMVACGAAGLLLFYLATMLSSSVVFRLSCGTAMFTAGSLVILLIIMFRLVPHKRSMATAMAAAGSSGWALVRWLTGQWMPSWNQLLNNRFFALYVLLSAAIGAIATYVYDDRANPRVNTVIKVVLRLGGLALVYASTWTCWPLSASCMGLLVASVMGPGVVRHVQDTSQRVQQAAEVTAKIIATPFRALRTPRTRTTPTPAPPGSRTPYSRPPSSIPASATNGRGTRILQHEVEEEENDGQDAGHRTPRDFRGFPALHLRTPPPDPWSVGRVKTFEDKVHQSLLRTGSAQKGAGASARRGAAAYNQESDDEHAHEEEGEGEEGEVHHLVKSGYIINPTSGRPVRIGGDTYLRLLEDGFTPNRASGRMEEPAGGVTPAGGRSTGARKRSQRSGR